METLVVVVAQHRNQCYSRGGKSRISDGGFGNSPSRGFRGINCRTFEPAAASAAAGGGILPPPSPGSPSCTSPHVLKRPSHYSSEPPKQTRRSSPIPISPKPMAMKFSSFGDDLSDDSERWAGPAYSNSPPPSSLPIPKFSLRQKRSVSLELPTRDGPGIVIRQSSKSAPSSPTRVSSYSSASDFFFSTDSATQNLRRILHLVIAED